MNWAGGFPPAPNISRASRHAATREDQGGNRGYFEIAPRRERLVISIDSEEITESGWAERPPGTPPECPERALTSPITPLSASLVLTWTGIATPMPDARTDDT